MTLALRPPPMALVCAAMLMFAAAEPAYARDAPARKRDAAAAAKRDAASERENTVPQDEAAQTAFRAGVDAAREERWPDALKQFEKAHSLSPRPVVLINLAGAQARTGRLTDAATNYRLIIEDQSQETASFRKAAAEILPALEARIPRVRLRPTGLTAQDVIQIDGNAVDSAALATGHQLDPGEHTLVVLHDGNERARVLFTLVERELRYITLPLPSLAQRPPPVAPVIQTPMQVTPTPSDMGEERSLWRSPWTWTAAALVVAGAAVTTYVLLDRREDPFTGNVFPGTIDVR